MIFGEKRTMFRSVKWIAPAIAACLALAGAGTAAAQTPAQAPAPVIIERIEPATLLEALARIGAEAELLGEDGEAYRVVFANGARAVLQRAGCARDDVCSGLLMLGLFTVPQDRPAADSEETRRSFSATYNAVSVITNERGEHLVKSYVIADGGITTENLTAQLGVFAEALGAYSAALYDTDD